MKFKGNDIHKLVEWILFAGVLTVVLTITYAIVTNAHPPAECVSELGLPCKQ